MCQIVTPVTSFDKPALAKRVVEVSDLTVEDIRVGVFAEERVDQIVVSARQERINRIFLVV